MPNVPTTDRYDHMDYRRSGRSGLLLPAVSLGLWQNFGTDRDAAGQRELLLHAVDHGVIHLDLANNYGPPPGAAEERFGQLLARDLAPVRDELVISTKAGYRMFPGPYGEWGSRKSLLDSLDASLRRMGVDHVDLFYSHRFDPDTPLEETMGALHHAVRSGRARYVGVSSYSSAATRRAAEILTDLGTPLTIHQPSYSMFNRWIEQDDLLGTLADIGSGAIVFSPLAQGLLSDRYLDGTPDDARASRADSFRPDMLRAENLERVRGLQEIAREGGRTLAQLAIAWTLRDPRVTSALLGVSSTAQLDDNLRALERATLSDDELAAIEPFAREADINLWRPPDLD